MIMGMLYEEFSLNQSSVDAVSAYVQDYLNKLNMERRDVQRIRLTVEELLLNLLTHYESNMKITVGLGKQFGRHVLRLRYQAEPFDPSKNSDNPLTDDMMRALGLFPAWICKGKMNTVSLILSDRPKRSTLFNILLAVIAAAGIGALRYVFPENVIFSVKESVLSPLSASFLGLLNTFVGIMILLTILNGILGMSNAETFGRMGKSLIAHFVVLSFAIGAVCAILILPFMHMNFSTGSVGENFALNHITQMFFDILPTNIVDPFKTGNTLQIVVIAVFVGCALLALSERGKHIRSLIGESATLSQQVVSSICTLIPLYVFSMLVQLIWSDQLQILFSVFKPIILTTIYIIAFVLLIWIISAFRLKYSPWLLMKKVLPVFVVAFTTASSMSAFSLGMETSEKKLGIKDNLVSFAYPLGSIIYMPSGVIYVVILVCSLAEIYQIPIGIPWLIKAVVISALIIIALPPVPGADLLIYTALFTNLGIPSEAIILATAAGVLLDYIITGTNVLLMILQITCEAKKLDCLNEAILLSE